VPAASTIGALLKAHGRVHGKTRRRVPRRSEPLAHCDAPNRVWCADFKGWFRTQDGRRCDPLTITDGATRYLLCCQLVERTGHALVAPVFDAVFREYGLPDIIRTDNGVPFAHPCKTGLSPLAVGWIKLGITPERIRPGKPQENGRHERMHRTLKEHTLNPPAETWRRQQDRFDAFIDHYNFERPHEATAQQPPGRFYARSTRPYPKRLKSPDYPSDWEPRRVYDKGSFDFRSQKRLHIGEALAGETIALAPSPLERYLEIYFGHVRIAYLDTKHLRVIAQIPKNALHEKEHQEAKKGPRNTSGTSKNCKPCSRSET
jgi:putative transposase